MPVLNAPSWQWIYSRRALQVCVGTCIVRTMATAKKRGATKPATSTKRPKKGQKKAAKAARKVPAEPAPKKSASKKRAAKGASIAAATPTPAPAPATTKKSAKLAKKHGKRSKSRIRADIAQSDPTLFAHLTEGERADAMRTLIEDKRLANMAKVGRYQVIAIEPLVLKPPMPGAGARLARIVVYDYASDRCVDASVNLDRGAVEHLGITRAQPMLARAEEATAISIAMTDKRVNAELSLGDEPQVAMHYWSPHDTDLAYARRSAAVIFGRPGARPSLVAVVDLLDNMVAEIIPADQW